MKKLLLSLLVLTGVVGGGVWAAHQNRLGPAMYVKNQKGAPVQITDINVAGSLYHATLQFDDSGTWTAYALRWTRAYGERHVLTSYQIFDKTITSNGIEPSRTFAPNAVHVSGGLSHEDHVSDGSALQSIKVELVFLIRADGSTWGNTLAGYRKNPDGTEESPYLTIMRFRNGE